MADISATDVKDLRERTGAGIMDCKSALAEAEGDLDRAIEILRVKGQASAAKRQRQGHRRGPGGLLHPRHRHGRRLVEIQCETDFVARSDDFKDFADEVAIHIAGTPSTPAYVTADEITEDDREAERRVFTEKAKEEGKPDDIVAKIVDGQLNKWAKDVALLEQEHIRTDRHEGKTIEELRAAISAKTGENVRIARFAHFRVGGE